MAMRLPVVPLQHLPHGLRLRLAAGAAPPGSAETIGKLSVVQRTSLIGWTDARVTCRRSNSTRGRALKVSYHLRARLA